MFDRVVVVDWSANSVPKLGVDSIWIAEEHDRGRSVRNLSTRAEAFDHLAALIDDSAQERILIGLDFSLGYPSGTAQALGLDGDPRQATWTHLVDVIVDDVGNRNNRFDVAAALNERMAPVTGAFWGHPPSWGPDHRLTATKPRPAGGDAGGPGTWRAVEDVVRRSGRRPASSWQLFGAGSVGSQMLVGIPTVERLRRRAPERVDIWPFTTGLTRPGDRAGLVVVAEVWPTMTPFDHVDHPVRDARQVIAAAAHLHLCARDGSVASLFEPDVPASWRERVEHEEGWILGVDGPGNAAHP